MLNGRGTGYYSSPMEVFNITNIQASDLNQADESELNNFLIERLKEVKDEIDTYCNRNFEEEGNIPNGIHAIARDICVNIIKNAEISIQTGTVTIENYPESIDTTVFTEDIQNRLNKYKKKLSFSFLRARRVDELEE